MNIGPGTLYVMATPIGNLGDVSVRAKEILESVDAVLCEDTRTSGKLLSHFGIKKPLISYTSKSTDKKQESILSLLREGKNLALISDAGTPAISDPGFLIVKQAYDEFGDDTHVVAIPGPSAVVSALSISGIPASEFIFLGFLPHKKGKET